MRIERSLKWRRWKLKYNRRSKNECMGRFGGGWNWKLGVQLGSSTIIFSLLICEVRFSWVRNCFTCGESYKVHPTDECSIKRGNI